MTFYMLGLNQFYWILIKLTVVYLSKNQIDHLCRYNE